MKNLMVGLAVVSSLGAWNAVAVSLDLTTAGASGFVNGAFFEQINPQSTGTGVIDPFLRIQANGTEEGFNNNVDAFTLDDVAKGGQTFNHEIMLSSVPIVNVGGVDYYQFLLDINEPSGGGNATISLHELEIWLSDTSITSFAGATGEYSDLSGSSATLAFDLDSGPDGDSVIELDYSLNAGSGAGDLFVYIPVSELGTDDKIVYLYSAFGSPNSSGDGFEEWSTLQSTTPPGVPDVGSASVLLGLGLLGLGWFGRKR